jgi:hypothetical protein
LISEFKSKSINERTRPSTRFSFGKINYKILLIGIGVIALGFILMFWRK